MMKRNFSHSCLVLSLMLAMGALASGSSPATAAGDAEAGAKKSIFCAYCHGADGNPPDNESPRLAGQSAQVLVAKMKHQVPYHNYAHPMMQAFVTGGCLNDQDIENLAAYFSKQPIRKIGKPSGALPAAK